ncbi:MAG: sugar transferase [Alphaproteobacteria bacterium]|nr:sugar transferase [Alphaproteobacteria bacterium]
MLRGGWFSLVVVAIDLAWLLGCTLWARSALGYPVDLADPWGLPWGLPWGAQAGDVPALALIPTWLLLLLRQGYYDPARTFTVMRSLQELSRATLAVLVVAMGLEWFELVARVNRPLFYAWMLSSWLTLALSRWSILLSARRLALPLSRQRVAIMGTGAEAARMARRLAREGRLAFEVVGFIDQRGERDARVPEARVLGAVETLRELVNSHRVDTIVLASPGVQRAEALELATRCHAMGLRVLQAPFNWGIVTPRVSFAQLGNLQLIDLTSFGYTGVARWMKRAGDIVVVSLGLLLVSPVLLLTALAIRLESPGPVLFTAPRVGKGGRAFPFIKFRSMVDGANQRKDDLREANESDGALFKIRDDPRITRVGRLIRRWSVDELPQFLNVLRGDMNLVGPRPLPVEDLAGLGDDPELRYWFELRHQVRPGITGLWQVRGRSEVGFQEMVRLDLYYVQSWSLWLDLKILLLTVPAVLRGRGAS